MPPPPLPGLDLTLTYSSTLLPTSKTPGQHAAAGLPAQTQPTRAHNGRGVIMWWSRRFSGQAWSGLALLLLHSSNRIPQAAAHDMTGLKFEVLDAAAIARMTVRRVEGGQAHGHLNFGWALRSLLVRQDARHHTHRIPHPATRMPSYSSTFRVCRLDGGWACLSISRLLTSLSPRLPLPPFIITDGPGPHHFP